MIESSQEERFPDVNWDRAWLVPSSAGLSPTLKSFLFMMSNDLLPNNEFLFKIGKVSSPVCSFCDSKDGRFHFLECIASGGPGLAGIEVLKEASSGAITAIDLLTLGLELNDHLRLPALLVLSKIGIEILHQRKNQKKSISKVRLLRSKTQQVA